MENIVYILSFMFFLGLCCIIRYCYLRCSDDEIETELERDQRKADKLADGIDTVRAGTEKSKELSESIGKNQSGAAARIDEARSAIARSKEKSRSVIDLADECLSILEEAEEKSKQS